MCKCDCCSKRVRGVCMMINNIRTCSRCDLASEDREAFTLSVCAHSRTKNSPW